MTERDDDGNVGEEASSREAGSGTVRRSFIAWTGTTRRWLFGSAIVFLMLVLFCEERLSDQRLSMTIDEGAHLYAGVEHWRSRDFGVNPEHPPLVKLVAALPLLGEKLPEVHPLRIHFFAEEYGGAAQMFRGREGDRLLARARLAAGLFTFLLATLVLLAAWEMFGPVAGLLALFFFVWEPTLLAHGALVTTDMGLACFSFAAVYAWWRWFERPAVVRLMVCGVATGLAMACKVSGVLVLPVLVACVAAELWACWRKDRVATRQMAGRLAGSLVSIAAIGYVVLWGFYTFRYAARPAGLVLTPTLEQFSLQLPHHWEAAVVERIATLHLLPEAYLFGWVKAW